MEKEWDIGRAVRQFLNFHFDRMVNPKLLVGGKSFSSYFFWVYVGFFIGTAVIFLFSYLDNISLAIMTTLVFMVALLLYALFKSTKIVGESYVFLNWARKSVYQYQIVAVAFTSIFLWILREPVLPYLDIMVLGLILYQAFGRIGCFMAGCCHGRPHNWGVRYGKKHFHSGYPYFLEKVRLFPIQLIESIWLFFLAYGCIVIINKASLQGDSLSWYLSGYGFGRFFFEFLRGNLNRHYWLWFSEAQWKALSLTFIVVCLEVVGVLPFHWLHLYLLLAMTLVVIVLVSRTKLKKLTKQQLLNPEHIFEVLENINWVSDANNFWPATSIQGHGEIYPFVGITSLGIEISQSIVLQNGNQSYKYVFSHKSGKFKRNTAKMFSILICRLKHPEKEFVFFEERPGIFQLLINKS